MKQTILITGANSFIAKYLTRLLESEYNLKFLTRNPRKSNEYAWDISTNRIDENALNEVDYIIHLAGSKLNDGTPLTAERKKLVYDSRIGGARLLRETLQKRQQKITSFISASAIGYYAAEQTDFLIDENGAKGTDFSAVLSDDWEKAADEFKTHNVAQFVAKLRVSLVLGNEGGIFPILKEIVHKQPAVLEHSDRVAYPWNHIEDMAGMFAFAVTNQLDGVFNTVAPEAITLSTLLKTIANESTTNQYKIAPFNGPHLVANKIREAGYVFKYPTIQGAVQQLIAAE